MPQRHRIGNSGEAKSSGRQAAGAVQEVLSRQVGVSMLCLTQA